MQDDEPDFQTVILQWSKPPILLISTIWFHLEDLQCAKKTTSR